MTPAELMRVKALTPDLDQLHTWNWRLFNNLQGSVSFISDSGSGFTHTNPPRLITRGTRGIKRRKFSPRARQRADKRTHLTSWFVRGSRLFDETQLGRRHAPDEEEEEQRVVAGVGTGHLMGGQDVMIGRRSSPGSAGDQVIRNVPGRLIVPVSKQARSVPVETAFLFTRGSWLNCSL